jgi:O-antigen ligase
MSPVGRVQTPAVFWVLLVVVVLVPLPLGAVDTWSWGLLAVIVGALLAVWSARVLLGREAPAFGGRRLWPLLLPFFLVAAWIWLQTVAFTPAPWHHPLWASAALALNEPLPGAISLDPFESLSGLARLLSYAGIFFLALQYGQRSARVRLGLLWVTYAGLIYALYGLIVHFLDLRSVLIFRKVAYLEDLTSTFVNRNSYATYAGLGLICASALLLLLIMQTLQATPRVHRRSVRVLTTIAERGWPLILAFLAMLLALLLTHSRAGFASTVLALATLLVTTAVSGSVNRRMLLAIGGGGLVVLTLFVAVNGAQMLQRFSELSQSDRERPMVYEATLDAIDDAGALGTGLGTFPQVFRFYRTPEIERSFDKAHSTYLENALELGVPAAVLLFLIPAMLALACFIGLLRRRRDAIYPCVGLAATALVATHSVVDFSLQIPAVAATYAFLLGLACAQATSSRRSDDAW